MHSVTSINGSSHTEMITERMRDSAALTLWSAEVCASSILAAAELIATSFKNGGKLMLCGNGGSAADCQHMAAELTSRLSRDYRRPALPAIALTTDTSFLTAFANDFDFEGVFARQVQALGKSGDVLLGITTSGKSKNVIRAAELATSLAIQVVTLTGARPAKTLGDEDDPLLADLADVAVCIPSNETQHIQESHLVVEHILCHLVERAVFGSRGAEDWGIRR